MKTIAISGIIGLEVIADDIRSQLNEANGDAIEIEVSSPGGLVTEGLEIFNLIKNYKGEKTTRLMGLAASMASYIVLAGDKIIAEDNAVYMIHNARGIGIGDHVTLRKTANIIEGLSSIFAKAYAQKSGKPIDEIKNMMNEETYLFGKEILDAGFIDEIEPAGTGPEDKESAIAQAHYAMNKCEQKLRESEIEDSTEKAVALIGDSDIDRTPIVNREPPKAETTNEEVRMNLDELKKEYPGVYAEAENIGMEKGAKAERDRRNALKDIASKDPENEQLQALIADAIEKGTASTDMALQTAVSVAIRDGKKLDGENPPAVETEPAGEDEDATIKATVEKLKNMGV